MIKSLDLSWIVVKDFEQAVKYYRDVLGLKVNDYNPEFKWAEFAGHDGGSLLGVCEACEDTPISAGQNAVVCFSVDDIDAATEELKKKGAELVGEKQVVPGHVAMQLIRDPSGNLVHIVQQLG